ncbi:MAG: hypothetical protein Q7U04_17670 [Bacteriovorax sp.]|nr:hypothetical protein [Bacteriovorax sp.]
MKNRKLKNYIIYPRFQLTLLLANILVAITALIMVYYKVNEVFEKLHQMGEKINLTPGHPYYNFVKTSQQMMNLNLSWAFGFSIFFTVITSLFISHKIAGPIYNLKKYFININNNQEQPEMKFRRGDYYEELPKIINAAITKLKEK